jgi:hypothetical protein
MKKNQSFCEIVRINKKSHSEIEFVNIIPSKDLKLFIEPTLIEKGDSKWAVSAKLIMESYFNNLFDAYKKHDHRCKLYMMSHCHEKNETRLGYSPKGLNGKGKTPEGMLQSLMGLERLFDNGVSINKAREIPIFVEKFAEDSMSDVLTNILSKLLHEFTLEIAHKYNIQTYITKDKYYYWDHVEKRWAFFEGEQILIGKNKKPVFLVPKEIVRNCYYVNADQYLRSVILSKMQKDNTSYDDEGKEVTPTKCELRKWIKNKNISVKETDYHKTMKHPELLEEHRRLLERKSGLQKSDEYLDKLVKENKK